ncbi:MAG: NADH-quinone oxidoreductase subunit J [Bacteroidota bacterium]
MTLLYLFLAGLVGTAGLLILLTPHVLYASLGLLGVLLGMAAIYFLQGAAFVAVAQVLVYGGGVLVLILFSTLLLPPASQPPAHRTRWVLIGVGLLVGLLPWVRWAKQFLPEQAPVSSLSTDGVVALGLQLVGPYALAFEWVGLNLLIALVGAVCLLQSPQNP